jgi:hypothetical protein
VAYVAAKSYYFGVGGGTHAFQQRVKEDGILECQQVGGNSDWHGWENQFFALKCQQVGVGFCVRVPNLCLCVKMCGRFGGHSGHTSTCAEKPRLLFSKCCPTIKGILYEPFGLVNVMQPIRCWPAAWADWVIWSATQC